MKSDKLFKEREGNINVRGRQRREKESNRWWYDREHDGNLYCGKACKWYSLIWYKKVEGERRKREEAQWKGKRIDKHE